MYLMYIYSRSMYVVSHYQINDTGGNGISSELFIAVWSSRSSAVRKQAHIEPAGCFHNIRNIVQLIYWLKKKLWSSSRISWSADVLPRARQQYKHCWVIVLDN